MDLVKILKYTLIGLVLGPFVVVSGALLWWLGRNPAEYVQITDLDLGDNDDFLGNSGDDVDER